MALAEDGAARTLGWHDGKVMVRWWQRTAARRGGLTTVNGGGTLPVIFGHFPYCLASRHGPAVSAETTFAGQECLPFQTAANGSPAISGALIRMLEKRGFRPVLKVYR